jgi:hypothetical protein
MPNKLKYNQDMHKKIVGAIEVGATHRAAARAFGVTPETLSIWKAKYPVFREDVERAEAEAQAFAEVKYFDFAKRDPKVLLTWLERRHPSEWSAKEQQPQDVVVWPETFSGWTALRYELDARFNEFMKHAKQNAPQTAAEEPQPIQDDTTNESKAA